MSYYIPNIICIEIRIDNKVTKEHKKLDHKKLQTIVFILDKAI